MERGPIKSVTVSQLPQRIPGQPGLSSVNRAWSGVVLRRYYNPASEALVPGLEDYWIAIHLGEPIDIDYNLGEGQRTGRAYRGSVTIVPNHAPGLWRLSGSADVLHLYIEASFIARIAEQVFDFDPLRIELIDKLAIPDPLIQHIGLTLLSELETQPDITYSRLYIDSLSCALASHLIRHYSSQQPRHLPFTSTLPHRKLQQSLDYIDEHLAEDISLSTLSALVDLSPYHFARLFRQFTGYSPHQYLLRQRINAAKVFLADRKYTLAEIAYRVGFSSQSHFTTSFSKWVGTTPALYRRTITSPTSATGRP